MIIFSGVSDTGGKRANSQLVTFISGCCKGHVASLDVHPHPKACLPPLGALHPSTTAMQPAPLLLLLSPPPWERGCCCGWKACKHTALLISSSRGLISDEATLFFLIFKKQHLNSPDRQEPLTYFTICCYRFVKADSARSPSRVWIQHVQAELNDYGTSDNRMDRRSLPFLTSLIPVGGGCMVFLCAYIMSCWLSSN